MRAIRGHIFKNYRWGERGKARYPTAQYKKLCQHRIMKLVRQLEQSPDCGVDYMCNGIAEIFFLFLRVRQV